MTRLARRIKTAWLWVFGDVRHERARNQRRAGQRGRHERAKREAP